MLIASDDQRGVVFELPPNSIAPDVHGKRLLSQLATTSIRVAKPIRKSIAAFVIGGSASRDGDDEGGTSTLNYD